MKNFNIAYNIIGRGESVIFIHGIGSRKYSWNGVIKELKDDYKCITYDLRGHGESEGGENEFTLDNLVEDLEKLRSHLNIDKIHLVGHSLGGMIAPSYIRKFQERVISATLMSTAAFRTIEDQQQILEIINRIMNEGLNTVMSSFIKRWFNDDFIENNQVIIDKRIKQVQETPLQTFLNVFRIYALTDIGPWLNEIKIPCLVMTGEHDLGCNPIINKKIANTLLNSKLEILYNLKHSITLEASQLVGNKIKKFLKSVNNLSTHD